MAFSIISDIKSSKLHTSQAPIYTDTEHWSPSNDKYQLIKDRVKFFIGDNDEHSRGIVLRDIVHNLFQGSCQSSDLGLEFATASSSVGAADAEEDGMAVDFRLGKVTVILSSVVLKLCLIIPLQLSSISFIYLTFFQNIYSHTHTHLY